MWKWKSDWGWCLGGAYFLAKFQAGGAYSGGAYKKKACNYLNRGGCEILFEKNVKKETLQAT